MMLCYAYIICIYFNLEDSFLYYAENINFVYIKYMLHIIIILSIYTNNLKYKKKRAMIITHIENILST